ncbi:DUF4400 domain-containing protein [Motilimonas cestriensis]|uniref:DUF4400 domain-containing protein n=1 Tax=Motilimonas cestriensis TaxID=2742685 RepID=A0ABS8WGG8_9GAMM|nr:DUF4400 domain-containing protein [Motilimonas cestriensis]MCE2597297.1 DUF4400 domain-containing protein [Motilimonas cestriensis]
MADNIFEDALMDDQSVRDEDDKRHIILYVLCAMFFGSVIFNVFVRSNESFKAGIRTEMRESYPVLGGPAWNETKSRSDRWYKFLMVNTGAEQYLDYTLAEKDKWYERSDFSKFQKLTIKIVDNIKYTVFQTTYRTSIFVYWLHLCLPFFFALLVDGYYERKIRKYRVGGITTKRSRLILHSVIFMFSMMFTYFVVPLEMTNIFQVIPPLVIIFVAIALRQVIAEYQKGI